MVSRRRSFCFSTSSSCSVEVRDCQSQKSGLAQMYFGGFNVNVSFSMPASLAASLFQTGLQSGCSCAAALLTIMSSMDLLGSLT